MLNLILKFCRKLYMAKILNPSSNADSIKNAIIVEAKTLVEGIKEEYKFLERKFGKKGKDWQVFVAAVGTKAGKLKGRIYDVLYLGFQEDKKPTWKPDPKDFLANFFRPFYFLVLTPKDKHKGNVEKIRREFKPKKVKVLLIGESPPPEKWVFFYNCNSTLYFVTKEVFKKVLRKEELDDDEFLEFFENKGFYLIDLYRRNDIWKKKNEKFVRKRPSERLIKKRLKELKNKIKELKPKFIITIGTTYVSKVIEKFDKSLDERIDLKLPFPKYGYKKKFYEEFARWLKK